MDNTRRKFIKSSAVGAGAILIAPKLWGQSRPISAADTIHVGVIGINSRGKYLADTFAKLPGFQVNYLCDVDSRALQKSKESVMKIQPHQPQTIEDFRELLEKKDIDAVVIATPDHMHAPIGIMACAAGKHVYVEKPASHTPWEGEQFIKATQKYDRVVQMGNQQRSSIKNIEGIQMIREGQIGEVFHAYTWYANNRKSIGNGKTTAVPAWLNWDLWQGCAVREPYFDNYVHYNWHWFWKYGTGETGNNATHEIDVARWALDLNHPVEVISTGTKGRFKDSDWEMYDTIHVTWKYENGTTIIWDGDSRSGIEKMGSGRGVMVYGDKGSMMLTRSGYVLFDPDGKQIEEGREEEVHASTQTQNLVGGDSLTEKHIMNFGDAVRDRSIKLNSPITEGSISTNMTHYANMAYREGEPLKINSKDGTLTSKVGKKYWKGEYEKGWEPKV